MHHHHPRIISFHCYPVAPLPMDFEPCPCSKHCAGCCCREIFTVPVLQVSEKADPRVIDNTIHDAVALGLYIHSRARGTFQVDMCV